MDYKQALQILSIKPPFDERELKKAYLSLAKSHHPDVGGTHEKFVSINNAYELLKNNAYLFNGNDWNSANKRYQNPFDGSIHNSVDDFVDDFINKAYRSAYQHTPNHEARHRKATQDAQYYQNNEVKYKPSESRKVPKTKKGFVRFWKTVHRVILSQLKSQSIPPNTIGEMVERKLKAFESDVCPIKEEWFLGALDGQFYKEAGEKQKRRYYGILSFIAPDANTRHQWAQKYFRLEFGDEFTGKERKVRRGR